MACLPIQASFVQFVGSMALPWETPSLACHTVVYQPHHHCPCDCPSTTVPETHAALTVNAKDDANEQPFTEGGDNSHPDHADQP